MNEVTRILSSLEGDNAHTAERLLPLVYKELRKLAARELAREAPGQTLQATALVHEAYLRLVNGDADRQWDGRGHFFAAAAEAMRRILVENARAKNCLKRGEGRKRLELDEADHASAPVDDDILDLDEALAAFEQVDPQAATLVKLRYFTGLPLKDAAMALEVSERTAYRDWKYARAWLQRFLSHSDRPEGKS